MSKRGSKQKLFQTILAFFCQNCWKLHLPTMGKVNTFKNSILLESSVPIVMTMTGELQSEQLNLFFFFLSQFGNQEMVENLFA